VKDRATPQAASGDISEHWLTRECRVNGGRSIPFGNSCFPLHPPPAPRLYGRPTRPVLAVLGAAARDMSPRRTLLAGPVPAGIPRFPGIVGLLLGGGLYRLELVPPVWTDSLPA
jgi:hypothetical protein